MQAIKIAAGPYSFVARLETERAPRTCAKFLTFLPLREQIIHVRWSGEAVWVPMGARDLGLGYENATSHPAPGEIILYPGGVSETELLIAYGAVSFSSKAGPLAGNHFLTVIQGNDALSALGKLVLWEGAQKIAFETA